MVEIIDPHRNLLQGRILCRRDDEGESHVKSLLRFSEPGSCMEPVTEEELRGFIVLDDRVSVRVLYS